MYCQCNCNTLVFFILFSYAHAMFFRKKTLLLIFDRTSKLWLLFNIPDVHMLLSVHWCSFKWLLVIGIQCTVFYNCITYLQNRFYLHIDTCDMCCTHKYWWHCCCCLFTCFTWKSHLVFATHLPCKITKIVHCCTLFQIRNSMSWSFKVKFENITKEFVVVFCLNMNTTFATKSISKIQVLRTRTKRWMIKQLCSFDTMTLKALYYWW